LNAHVRPVPVGRFRLLMAALIGQVAQHSAKTHSKQSQPRKSGPTRLADIEAGTMVRVLEVTHGPEAKRLHELGLVSGAYVEVISKGAGCSMVLGIENGRFALCSKAASHVTVEPAI